MKQFRNIILVMLILVIQSCLDMLENNPQKFVGKIYLRNNAGSHNQNLVLIDNYKKNAGYTYRSIFIESISVALGDDSLIYTISESQGKLNYHLIRHTEGNEILGINIIDSLSFSKFTKGKIFKYSFINK